MPRNGSGVYSLPAGLPANGETSNATDDILTPFGDLETDMNTARPVVAGGTGATSASAARTNLGLGTIATQAASSVAVTGGAIDGTAIGGTTPAAGAFTTLSATGNVTIFSTTFTAVTGTDTSLVTGTAGAADNVPKWDANGDIVSGYTVGTSANNLVQLNGSAELPAVSGANLTNLQFISSTDFSNDTDGEFTLDNTNYDVHVLELQNVIPATDSVDFIMRTSATGGAPYDSGASDYGWAYVSRVPGNNNNTDDQADTKLDITNVNAPVGSAAGEGGVSGTIVIYGAGLSQDTQIVWDITYTTDSGGIARLSGGGARLSAAAATAVQVLFDSGNIESGTITHSGTRSS